MRPVSQKRKISAGWELYRRDKRSISAGQRDFPEADRLRLLRVLTWGITGAVSPDILTFCRGRRGSRSWA
jgi:hypothetical protein